MYQEGVRNNNIGINHLLKSKEITPRLQQSAKSQANMINKKKYKVKCVPKIQILKLSNVLDDRVETLVIRPGKWLLTVHNGKKLFIPKLDESGVGSNQENEEVRGKIRNLRRKRYVYHPLL